MYFYAVAYVCGSIPFGLLLTALAGYGDIRDVGSGNIGATNVLRTGNKKIAVLTLLCDALKGTLPVLIAQHYMPSIDPYCVALMAFLGHLFPVWLKFKGGKGVATAIGVYLALFPFVALWVVSVWAIVAKVFKISSLAALVSFLTVPLFVYAIYPDAFYFSLLITALIVWAHRSNIGRLIKGEEKRV